MSEYMDDDARAQHQRVLLHGARQAPARQPLPGEEVWRLVETATGRVQSCELRNDTKAGAGWGVMIRINGEPLFSRRCGDEQIARYYAQAMKQDNMHGGEWADDEQAGINMAPRPVHTK